jgi:hypothetical protein
VHAGTLLRLGSADVRIQRGNIEQEPKELLNPWQEAGSRGLDTWFELPAVYAIPDGSGNEAGRGYDCSSLMEHYLVTLDSDKTHEGYYAWLEYELARWKV